MTQLLAEDMIGDLWANPMPDDLFLPSSLPVDMPAPPTRHHSHEANGALLARPELPGLAALHSNRDPILDQSRPISNNLDSLQSASVDELAGTLFPMAPVRAQSMPGTTRAQSMPTGTLSSSTAPGSSAARPPVWPAPSGTTK